MMTTMKNMAEDPRGRSDGVGGMRRSALVIRCGYSDLSARIASDQSEGWVSNLSLASTF